MRQDFVDDEQIQIIIEAFNQLYDQMISNNYVDAEQIKNFLEPVFKNTCYRDNIKSKYKNNILVINDAGVGDFILISAFLRELRRIYPKANITLIVCNTSLSLAEHCPYVDDLFFFDDNAKYFNNFFKFYKSAINLSKKLLRRKFDVAFNLSQRPCAPLLAYMSGAIEIVNQLVKSNSEDDIAVGRIPLAFFYPLATYYPPRGLDKPHYNELFLYILQKFSKSKISNKNLEIWLSPLDNVIIQELLYNIKNKLYAIVPGSSEALSIKRWAPENYAALINLILQNEDSKFILLGGKAELESAQIIKSLVPEECIIDLTDKLNFRQSCAALKFCDCYIGNDTALLHAAAVFKIPVLSPNCFPADIKMTVLSFPQQYYPYAVPSVIVQPSRAIDKCKVSPNLVTGCNADYPHCINQITPEKMFEGLKFLNKQISKKAKEPLFFG